MKKSIRVRITITFVFLMVLLIGGILLFNTFFLERLYIRNRVKVLEKTYVALDEGLKNYLQNGEELSSLFPAEEGPGSTTDTAFTRFLRGLQDTYNINIILADQDNNSYSLFQNNNRYDKRLKTYLFDRKVNKSTIIEENDKYSISVNYLTTPPNANNKKNEKQDDQNISLECFGTINSQINFLMSTPMMSIKEPINLFNNVLVAISLFALIIGSIVIFFTSYGITQPIIKLAKLSKEMSNQNFESRYEGKREDEIGLLGNSMNEMSDSLEVAIKDLKNANIKLQADIEQKDKLDQMRKDFISNVSHELKTPIALIQGYAESLEGGIAKTDEDRKYYLDVILDEAEKMNKLVHQLLDLSSLEKEIDDVEIERIDFYELVENIVKNTEIILKEKNVNLSLDIKKDTYVWADEFKLEEVVRNYLTNAINHVDENKLIKLYTEKLEENKIRFFVYNSGEQLSKDNLSNIWEKFYKTDKARTRSYGGTGLGLSIVKAISKKFKTDCGCFNIDEDKNKKLKKGIVFYFDLNTK